MGILRLSHVEVRVPDLELATAYYTEVLGLIETGREDDRIFLKCWDEQEHHSIVRSGIERTSSVERSNSMPRRTTSAATLPPISASVGLATRLVNGAGASGRSLARTTSRVDATERKACLAGARLRR